MTTQNTNYSRPYRSRPGAGRATAPSRSRRPAGSIPLLRDHQRGAIHATVQAWKCTCGTSWAITVANPCPAYFEQLGAAVEEVGRLRWTLAEIIALADDAPQLADEQLRDRLLALAECAR